MHSYIQSSSNYLAATEPTECLIVHTVPAVLEGGILVISWYVMNDIFQCLIAGLAPFRKDNQRYHTAITAVKERSFERPRVLAVVSSVARSRTALITSLLFKVLPCCCPVRAVQTLDAHEIAFVEKLRELWIIPIFFVIVTVVSMVVAYILGIVLRLKRSQR